MVTSTLYFIPCANKFRHFLENFSFSTARDDILLALVVGGQVLSVKRNKLNIFFLLIFEPTPDYFCYFSVWFEIG
jgi:hypothetical protein